MPVPTPKNIKKRDGRIVPFDPQKIALAIFKAGQATGEFGPPEADRLSDLVVAELIKRGFDGDLVTVEQVQDIVEETLMREEHFKTAKAYILYREQHTRLRELKGIDSDKLMTEYLEELDWKVKENANMSYSLQGLNNYVASAVSSHYWLNKIYPPKIRQAHLKADFHLHNLQLLAPYCCGWDLKDLLLRGFGGVRGKIESKPPKHFRTALGQLVNFLYTLQGEIAGAVAVANFDTYLAPFIHYDGLDYKQVRQSMQEFMFWMNVPTRVGFQTPFSNVTLDITPPGEVGEEQVIIGGKVQNKKYKDFQKEMGMFNRAFGEIMLEGDAKGRVFTFPIPTYNITKNFSWNNPDLEPVWEMTAKYGIPYFANFINSDMKPEDIRSMCCRLRLDLSQLQKRGGSLFGSNPLTGCYDEETEILTESGWKFFKNLTQNEKIFTLTVDNEIELHKPKRLFEYDYQGAMCQFKTKSLDLLVTPNHKMVVDQVGSGKRKFVEAKDFDPNNQWIPKQSIWGGEEKEWFILPGIEFTKYGRQGRTPYQVVRDTLKIKMDDWLKFFGFWLAEGCIDNEKIAKRHGYRVVISQTNKQKRDEVAKVLDHLPFNYYLEGENNFVICNKQVWTYLRQFGKGHQKFIPWEIKNLSKKQLKILFDWMVKGDGHVRKTTGQINYWTSSRKLADDLQEVILKLGWLGTMTTQRKKVSQIKGRKIKAGIVYVLGVQRAKRYRLRRENIKEVYYKGKVYCCEVKNHAVFVRRNGKVTWCGNSIGVVTINTARIGRLSKSEREFFERLGYLMDLAKESLEIKRKTMERFTAGGLYPYARHYLDMVKERFGNYWANHFSTIGLNGMNEALEQFLGVNIGTEKGRKFALKVLDFMRERLLEYQKETGHLYNLEATPAEGTTYTFAKADGEKYYTNSTQLPVDFTDDLFEALDLQDELQCKYTGGTVFHAFLGERLPSGEVAKKFVRKVFENYRLPYFTLTPTFSICTEHGYLSGEQEKCPRCGKECEVYSRVVGYLRPVNQWNVGKQAEFAERREFSIPNPKG